MDASLQSARFSARLTGVALVPMHGPYLAKKEEQNLVVAKMLFDKGAQGIPPMLFNLWLGFSYRSATSCRLDEKLSQFGVVGD